ncbi:MAG: hypothetical protein IBJ08_17745, partial [Pseudomonas sp.]|nr:hypothetical protein [Pseudomonas sp.]
MRGGEVNANDLGLGLEAELVAQILVGLGFQLLPNKLAGAEQHQAIDQLCGTGAGLRAIDEHQGLLAGFGQVCGNGRAITRCAGDQRIERGTPGVHGVGNQLDLFERNLRLIG